VSDPKQPTPKASAEELLHKLDLLAAIREPYRRGTLSPGCVQVKLETIRELLDLLRSRLPSQAAQGEVCRHGYEHCSECAGYVVTLPSTPPAEQPAAEEERERAQSRPPHPPPRYDEVHAEGTRMLYEANEPPPSAAPAEAIACSSAADHYGPEAERHLGGPDALLGYAVSFPTALQQEYARSGVDWAKPAAGSAAEERQGLVGRLRQRIQNREEHWPLCDEDAAVMRDALEALEANAASPADAERRDARAVMARKIRTRQAALKDAGLVEETEAWLRLMGMFSHTDAELSACGLLRRWLAAHRAASTRTTGEGERNG
jgi:hypothetical protein